LVDLTKKVYLPELDGLRACAIFLVLLSHFGMEGCAPLGYMGVSAFFVLSGYLITSNALVEEAAKGAISIAAFYVRRAFRIFPLYYLILGVYCFLILGLNLYPEKHGALKEALPFYLVYLQEIPYLRTPEGVSLPFYQSWSLGIEEKLYLVWPLICFVALVYKTTWRIPVALSLIFLCSLSRYTRPYVPILFGCVLALSFRLDAVRKLVERTSWFGLWVASAILLALHLAPTNIWTSEIARMLYAMVFTVFLGFLLPQANAFKKVLSSSPLVFIGKMSYGIYLVHLLCLGALRVEIPIQNKWLLVLVTLGLSLLVATVLHYTLELPFIQLGRRLSNRVASSRSAPLLAPVDGKLQA
jgi:peptidoglycan/LPS O-acetylase OafA/YrhL